MLPRTTCRVITYVRRGNSINIKPHCLLLPSAHNDITITNTNIHYRAISSTTKLYPDHIPTNPLQKAVLAVGSAFIAFADPWRGDLVAVLGETTGICALRAMHNNMLADPVGRQILSEKPIISEQTLPNDLHTLPETTFGGAYYKFMSTHGFNADERSPVRLVDDPDLAYVMLRYRQVHDFWHALSGLGISVSEEVAVKWVEMIQTGLPMNAMSALVGSLRAPFSEKMTLYTKMIPWAIYTGKNTVNLMCVKYEDLFYEDLDVVRKKLNFAPFQQ